LATNTRFPAGVSGFRMRIRVSAAFKQKPHSINDSSTRCPPWSAPMFCQPGIGQRLDQILSLSLTTTQKSPFPITRQEFEPTFGGPYGCMNDCMFREFRKCEFKAGFSPQTQWDRRFSRIHNRYTSGEMALISLGSGSIWKKNPHVSRQMRFANRMVLALVFAHGKRFVQGKCIIRPGTEKSQKSRNL